MTFGGIFREPKPSSVMKNYMDDFLTWTFFKIVFSFLTAKGGFKYHFSTCFQKGTVFNFEKR
jgi:hypothetical protein